MLTVQLEEGSLYCLSGGRGLRKGAVCGACLAYHQLKGLLEAATNLQQQQRY